MIRALFAAQFAYFLGFGIMAGMAFTYYINHEVTVAKRSAVAAVYITLPLTALSDIRL
jgi:hypothetical protein